jgi:two-component system, OmpR family, sensor histidine kinase MprB
MRAELVELGDLIAELVAGAADGGDPEAAAVVPLDTIARRLAERTARRHDRPVEVLGTGAAVVAPPTGLTRAVGNLLENAVKFSPPGSPVTVELDGGCLRVLDDGPGIAPDETERVFDRFYRSPASRTLPGSGLGLAIVRQVVEGAGGTVEVCPRSAATRPSVGFRLPAVTVPVERPGTAGQPEARVR